MVFLEKGAIIIIQHEVVQSRYAKSNYDQRDAQLQVSGVLEPTLHTAP